MRIIRALLVVLLVTSVVSRILEWFVLRRIARSESPPGWSTPRFPDGHDVVVPASDGALLSVRSAGDPANPTALLIHGITQDRHHMGPIAARLLAAGWYVVGLDQRGHGASGVGTEGFSAARLGADVGDVVESLDLTDVVIIGHSLGGIATLSLLTGPERSALHRVSAAVLAATTAQADDPARKLAARIAASPIYEMLNRDPRHGQILRRAAFGPTPSTEMLAALGRPYEHLARSDELAAAAGLATYDVTGALGAVTVPLTVICGTRDVVTPILDSHLIARATGAELIQLSGLGHTITWEAPEVIAEAALQARARAGSDT